MSNKKIATAARNTRIRELEDELSQARNQLSDMSLLMAVNLDLEKARDRYKQAAEEMAKAIDKAFASYVCQNFGCPSDRLTDPKKCEHSEKRDMMLLSKSNIAYSKLKEELK